MDYSIVKRGPQVDGVEARWIVISRERANERDLESLAAQLVHDTGDHENVLVFVYTDEVAAGLYDKICNGKATLRELVYYDRHYVGRYLRHKGAGYHQLSVYVDGDGSKAGRVIELPPV
ncbi:MAG: hypothetical protein M3281_00435 [Chloroflexota bacterium]|nr:hypothetical protein [Chloroflexota bacterium]